MYFAEVRPLDEIFREDSGADASSSAEAAMQMGGQTLKLAELQKADSSTRRGNCSGSSRECFNETASWHTKRMPRWCAIRSRRRWSKPKR
jgi:hypothetical protein